MKRTRTTIAVQKDGRLKDNSLALLESLGFCFERENGRSLLIPCTDRDVDILYARQADIPQYVQSGVADYGIVGANILEERSYSVEKVTSLGFGVCRLVIAVPEKAEVNTVAQLEGERIATSYPNTLRAFLGQQRVEAALIEIQGAVEATPALGLADAICDLTQTGNTLRENGLRPIVTVYESEAVLIRNAQAVSLPEFSPNL